MFVVVVVAFAVVVVVVNERVIRQASKLSFPTTLGYGNSESDAV